MKFDPMQLPVLVERDQLHRRDAVALGEPAVDLALDDHRVDPHAAVVDGDHPPHLPHAGVGVDLDRHRRTSRTGTSGSAGRSSNALEPGLHPVGEVRVRGERDLLDRLDLVGRALDVERSAVSNSMSSSDDLQQVRGDLPGLLADAPRHHRRGRARPSGSTATRTCPARTACCPCRRACTLMSSGWIPSSSATICANVVSWPWPCVCDADLQDRLAGRVDAQLGAVVHLQAEDVVVLVRPGADDLGERREPDPVAACPARAPPPAPRAGRRSRSSRAPGPSPPW